MKTKIEKLSDIKRKLTVDVPVERVVDALEKAYQKVQKSAKMDGFREGKVPREMLEIHFKDHAEKEAVEIVVDATLKEAFDKEAIFPVTRPTLFPGPFTKNAEYTYAVEFEVNPTVNLEDYHGLALEKTEHEIKEEDIDRQLEGIQRSFTQLEPALEGAWVDKGKVAFIDFNGTANGKPFKGGKADNFMVDIGSNSLLPVFEEKIIGMKKGETRKIEFEYPKDYFNKEIAGAKGVFDVTVREIKMKKVPPLDDSFAKDLGDFKTLDDVRADIRKKMQEGIENQARMMLGNQALEILVKKHKFDIPEGIVMQELKYMFESFIRNLTAQGKKFEDTGIKAEQFIEQYKPAAENRARGYYILDAIATAEKIEVSQAELDEKINEIAKSVRQPLDKVKDYYAKDEQLQALRNQILHEKTLDFVVSKAKIKTKKAKK